MKATLLLFVSLALVAFVPAPASACAEGEPCYWVNDVCILVFGNGCIPTAESDGAFRCDLDACEQVNRVCRQLFQIDCLG